jgi:GDP-4-dehydro-6-deoxy-D-mannose reductase
VGKKLLITGATGCAGSYQIKNICENYKGQYNIYATKRARSSLERIDPENQKTVAFHIRDLTDAFAIADLIGEIQPEIIMHYAADTFIPPSSHNPHLYICHNSQMVINILNAIRLVKCHQKNYDPVVFITSSLEVYGTQFNDEEHYRKLLKNENGIWPPPRYENGKFISEIPLKEDNPLRPVSPYAIGKCTIENVTNLYCREYGIKTVLVRCCNQTGPGRLPNFAETNFALQVSLIMAGYLPAVIRHGNLEPIRDFLNYKDTVRAHFALVLRALDRQVDFGTPINIGSGTGHSIQEILEFYLSKAREAGIEIKTEVDPKRVRAIEVPVIIADNRKLREITGWRPEIPFEQTLEEILDYWSSRVAKGGKKLLQLI